jgi:hypothetical protein
MPDTRDRVRRLKAMERHISPETEHGIEKVRSMWRGIRGLVWTWRRAEEKYKASKYEVSGERNVAAHKDI